MRLQFHFTALGKAEQDSRTGADHLARFDPAFKHQPGGGGDHVEPAALRLQHAQLRPGDADLRVSGIAGRAQPVDIGLGHKALVDQPQRTVEVGLRQIGVGPRDLNLRGLARLLLDLNRTINHRHHLPGADPLPGFDQYRQDLPAFTGDPDRQFAPRGQGAGR